MLSQSTFFGERESAEASSHDSELIRDRESDVVMLVERESTASESPREVDAESIDTVGK